jgi:hypothetical protein
VKPGDLPSFSKFVALENRPATVKVYQWAVRQKERVPGESPGQVTKSIEAEQGQI